MGRQHHEAECAGGQRVPVEQADIAISDLVGNIRDQRLSPAIQEFVKSRRACQQAMR